MGEYAKAEPLYQEALQIYQKVLGPEHSYTATSLDNLALLEFDLGRINEATAIARRASVAELTILSKMFSFTSEQQRLAYLDIFDPYGLFPTLKGIETDLAAAVLRYKGAVLDSIVEDRLLAEASQGSGDQKLVEQLNLDKRNWANCFCNRPKSSPLRQTSESRHSKGRSRGSRANLRSMLPVWVRHGTLWV